MATAAAVRVHMRGMVLAEVDVPLAAFIAVAFALMLHSKTVGSAGTFAGAMLISPLAGLSLPAFVVPLALARGRRLELRVELKRLVLFAAVSLTIYGVVVLLNWQDYVYGGAVSCTHRASHSTWRPTRAGL